MKYIQLAFELSDELGLKKVVIFHNDSGIENSAELLKLLSIALIRSLVKNKEDIELQEILYKCGIKTDPK